MKHPIQKWLITLVAAGALLAGATPLAAQETNQNGGAAAPTDTTVLAEDSAADTNAASASEVIEKAPGSSNKRSVQRGPMVEVGKNVELKAGQSAETVVVIGGSATIRGHVSEAVVVIGGDIEVEEGAEIGEAAVAVMGNIRVAKGAIIHQDAVAVGGKVDASEGAKIEGRTQDVEFGGIGLPRAEWLRKWFTQCVLKLRPLAPGVPWVWAIAGCVFLLYALIALAFPRPVQACVEEMKRRPATTFLMGLLTKLLLPLVLLILAVTGIGLFVVPFVVAAIILGAMVGKVALLEALGFKLTRHFGTQASQPVLALVIGALIVTALYMVPIVGLLVLGVTSVWGLGIAVTTGFGSFRREMPEKTSPPAPPAPTETGFTPANLTPMTSAPAPMSASFAATPGPTIDPSPTPGVESTTVPILPSAPPVLPEVLSFPKASFWERMGAAFLDIVLVSILGSIVGGPPLGFLVALAYFSGMWAWKATTIGGIVLGLKVTRVDGQPVTFTVALVRGLAAAFSAIVLFLGFLWIAWDPDRQGWHDRIAGTVVLRLPRGTPLVCF